MQVEFCEVTGHRATYGVQSSAAEPIVSTDSEWVEGHTGPGGGPVLVRLRVQGPDGRYATAWVRARLNNRGQIQFELSTRRRERTVWRRLTALWRL